VQAGLRAASEPEEGLGIVAITEELAREDVVLDAREARDRELGQVGGARVLEVALAELAELHPAAVLSLSAR